MWGDRHSSQAEEGESLYFVYSRAAQVKYLIFFHVPFRPPTLVRASCLFLFLVESSQTFTRFLFFSFSSKLNKWFGSNKLSRMRIRPFFFSLLQSVAVRVRVTWDHLISRSLCVLCVWHFNITFHLVINCTHLCCAVFCYFILHTRAILINNLTILLILNLLSDLNLEPEEATATDSLVQHNATRREAQDMGRILQRLLREGESFDLCP